MDCKVKGKLKKIKAIFILRPSPEKIAFSFELWHPNKKGIVTFALRPKESRHTLITVGSSETWVANTGSISARAISGA